MNHDATCESAPGGKYEGRTIGGTSDPIPCHCAARESGRREAEAANRAAKIGA